MDQVKKEVFYMHVTLWFGSLPWGSPPPLGERFVQKMVWLMWPPPLNFRAGCRATCAVTSPKIKKQTNRQMSDYVPVTMRHKPSIIHIWSHPYPLLMPPDISPLWCWDYWHMWHGACCGAAAWSLHWYGAPRLHSRRSGLGACAFVWKLLPAL